VCPALAAILPLLAAQNREHKPQPETAQEKPLAPRVETIAESPKLARKK